MNTTPNALFKSSILLKFKLGRNLIPIDSTHLLRVEKKIDRLNALNRPKLHFKPSIILTDLSSKF